MVQATPAGAPVKLEPTGQPVVKARINKNLKVRSQSQSNATKQADPLNAATKLKDKRSKTKQLTQSHTVVPVKKNLSDNTVAPVKLTSGITLKKKKSLKKAVTKSSASLNQPGEPVSVSVPQEKPTEKISSSAFIGKVASNVSEGAATLQGSKGSKSRNVVLKSSLKHAPKSTSRVSFKTTENGVLEVQEKKFLKANLRAKKIKKSPKRLTSPGNLRRGASAPQASSPKASASKSRSKSPSKTRTNVASTGNATNRAPSKSVSSKSAKALKPSGLNRDGSYMTVVTPEFFKQLKEMASPRTATAPVIQKPTTIPLATISKAMATKVGGPKLSNAPEQKGKSMKRKLSQAKVKASSTSAQSTLQEAETAAQVTMEKIGSRGSNNDARVAGQSDVETATNSKDALAKPSQRLVAPSHKTSKRAIKT